MRTAVAAPAQWQDIIDTLDAMTPGELWAVAEHLLTLVRFEPQDMPALAAYAEDYRRIVARGDVL